VSQNPRTFYSQSGFGCPFRYFIRSTAVLTKVFFTVLKEMKSQGAKLELYGVYSKMAKFYLSVSSVVATRSVCPVLLCSLLLGMSTMEAY